MPANVEYIPIHSLNLSVLEGMKRHTSMRQEGEPVRIGFIGNVRFFDRNKKLLDVFANDVRFELHYYGTNAEVLEKYAEENGIQNTVFHGSFPVDDTKKFLENIDIMNNLYGNETINLQKAISIKFFHALYARIPVLVDENTYVGELAQEMGIGFEVHTIDENMKESLYKWYSCLDFDTIDSSCKSFLEKTSEENRIFEEISEKYLL